MNKVKIIAEAGVNHNGSLKNIKIGQRGKNQMLIVKFQNLKRKCCY